MTENIEQLTARLNSETARVSWQELEKHFARGAVMSIAPTLDLIEVAIHIIQDDKSIIDAWLETGDLRNTTDEDARAWSKSEPQLWAVVVAPWVLVQDKTMNAGYD